MFYQPFGGVKKSAIGFERKVGVYNYIMQLLFMVQQINTIPVSLMSKVRPGTKAAYETMLKNL
ncbi:hypothetical protein OQH61_07370 [Helicobacter sp. MIT 21-1697]|uniref:hypothetical protein n=1 Tax=Helicobacter sp. MIT 21-1697 TaxID=2993733 RepID=UPI00224B26F5|nr:hypothetical protein [Helicobacter sp. MIT 21-1697]MCX2717550.1 hypothetical protein [Helicobacter sp. MIT 21-1697]